MKFPAAFINILFVCILFFFLGFIGYPSFYELVLPDLFSVKYQMDLVKLEDRQTLFAGVWALVPFLIFFTWQIIPLYSGDKKTFTVFIVIICMVLATYTRYKMLVYHFNKMADSFSDKSAYLSFPFEQLNFEWYLAGGLLTGCIISYLAFHNKVVRRSIFIGDNPDVR